jgi:mono/diheme cytochrome c family protein
MAQRAKVWLNRRARMLLVMLVSAGGLGSLIAVAQQPVANQNRNALPGAAALTEAAGKDVVIQVCSQCHNLERIAGLRRTARQWKAMAELMAARSVSPPTAPQLQTVVDYLQQHLSRPETREEAAVKDPLMEVPVTLPLEQARDLSGVWMQVSWYTNLNMGPGAGLPMAHALRGATDPTKTSTDSLTPWAKEKSKDWTIYNDPLLLCNSPGPTAYNAPYAFEMLQTPGRVTMLLEYYHEVRRIWTDGRKHPEDNPNPTAMGYSIGRWEGATLVVDTRSFKESPAFRVPHSDQYHLIERIRRVRDGSLLEIDVSIEDPIAYTQPLKGRFYFKKDPALEITEYNCDGMFDYRPYTPKK